MKLNVFNAVDHVNKQVWYKGISDGIRTLSITADGEITCLWQLGQKEINVKNPKHKQWTLLWDILTAHYTDHCKRVITSKYEKLHDGYNEYTSYDLYLITE